MPSHSSRRCEGTSLRPWAATDRGLEAGGLNQARRGSDWLHEPAVPLGDEFGIGHVATVFVDHGVCAGDVAGKPLAVARGHEYIRRAVNDLGRDADPGHVEAPRASETEVVVDPAPDSVTQASLRTGA